MENSIDWKTSRDLRKYFNSSERQEAKRKINEVQELLLEDKEIKARDIEDLHRAADRKLNDVSFQLARTFHKLGVPLIPGGEKMDFRNTYGWSDFDSEWDWSDMSEDELLEFLALSTKQKYVVDLNRLIKHLSSNRWWDEYC